jgi:hypothetical protein
MKKIFFALPFVLLAACNNSSDYDTTSTDKKDTIINTPFDSGKTVSKSGNPGFKDTTSYERQSTTTPQDTSK